MSIFLTTSFRDSNNSLFFLEDADRFAITFRSTPPSMNKYLFVRKNSRVIRFILLRSTAMPTFFDTVIPKREFFNTFFL